MLKYYKEDNVHRPFPFGSSTSLGLEVLVASYFEFPFEVEEIPNLIFKLYSFKSITVNLLNVCL